MLSNPPEIPARPAALRAGAGPRRSARAALALVASLIAATVLLTTSSVATAQDVTDTPDGLQATTTVVGEVGPVSECSPGHIVRKPNCGIPPQSPTDPGGWLQLSLFYLICAAVVGMVGFVWWRSRVARNERRAAGLDPLTLARERGQDSGQANRRSTRSEPVAEMSSNAPDANAGK